MDEEMVTVWLKRDENPAARICPRSNSHHWSTASRDRWALRNADFERFGDPCTRSHWLDQGYQCESVV